MTRIDTDLHQRVMVVITAARGPLPSVDEIAYRVRMFMPPTTSVDVGRAINDLKDAGEIVPEKVEYWGWRVKE